MKLPVFLQILFNKISGRRFYYVTMDVCPDFNTGQSEVWSCVVKAETMQDARTKAVGEACKEWLVTEDAVWVVDVVVLSNDSELIQNE